MLFHIFASSSPVIKTKINRDLAKDPTNLSSCLDDFDDLVSNSDYTDIYLVVDFGVYKPKMFEYVETTTIDNKLTFLVLLEYHIEEDFAIEGARDNSISLESQGFNQIFKDNRAALEKLIYYIYNKIPCKVSCIDPSDNTNKVQIIDVKSILSDPNRGYIKKFIISND